MNSSSRAELSERLRCQANDLALVIHDTADCASNIGRVVRVRGPVIRSNRSFNLLTWLIRPVLRTRWSIASPHGTPYRQTVGWVDQIEHPDAWLLPLRPTSMDESDMVRQVIRNPLHTPVLKVKLQDSLAVEPSLEFTSGLSVELGKGEDELGHFIIRAIKIWQRDAQSISQLDRGLYRRFVNAPLITADAGTTATFIQTD